MFNSHHHWSKARFGRHSFSGHGRRGDLGGRGERASRMFASGDLKFVLLALIAEKPSHGYELIKSIEERLGGGYSPSPGVVYPTLTLLEEMGYASVEAQEGGKRLYSLTEAGRAYLAENKPVIDAIFARMEEAGARGGRFSPQILRAMENLRTALRYRLAAGPLTEAQVRAVAEALDQAALAVERT